MVGNHDFCGNNTKTANVLSRFVVPINQLLIQHLKRAKQKLKNANNQQPMLTHEGGKLVRCRTRRKTQFGSR
jgi:hypothetical protein